MEENFMKENFAREDFMGTNTLILGKNQYYSLDSHKTQLNNNVLVVGASGAGKTRNIVIPNLLQASGSYIVSDPKGTLYKKYGKYMEEQGYIVKNLDFTNPAKSEHYNFFEYIRNTQDIVKAAHMIIYQQKSGGHADPFWDQAAQLLVQAMIAYLMETGSKNEQNIHNLMRMINKCNIFGDVSENSTPMDDDMNRLRKKNPLSYAVNTYDKYRVAADKTARSILITVNARLGLFDTPELNVMTQKDSVDIGLAGRRKTALFVTVSDTDRSLDGLVNIFFTQAMNELCRVADELCDDNDNMLHVPVRFILDDFATNCKIEEFPRMISSIRSRGISAMLMIQAESQLTECYGNDGRTIISNCDSYVYLGGNDVETARAVAERCDVPVKKVLNMPVGTSWIFRRGQQPVNSVNLSLENLSLD